MGMPADGHSKGNKGIRGHIGEGVGFMDLFLTDSSDGSEGYNGASK